MDQNLNMAFSLAEALRREWVDTGKLTVMLQDVSAEKKISTEIDQILLPAENMKEVEAALMGFDNGLLMGSSSETVVLQRNKHDSLQRIKRFGVDETSIWNKYLTSGGRAIKPEFLIKLTQIAKKDSIVTITSLYVHLLDQFLWKLLGEEEIVVEANYLLAQMADELQVEAVQVTRVTVSEFNNAWEKLVISAIKKRC